MRKYGWIILFLIGVNGLFLSQQAEAAEKMDHTEVGITFIKEVDSTPFPINPNPPIPGEISTAINPKKDLPSMGELLTSVIWLFVGVSLLIVAGGVYSWKKVMQIIV